MIPSLSPSESPGSLVNLGIWGNVKAQKPIRMSFNLDISPGMLNGRIIRPLDQRGCAEMYTIYYTDEDQPDETRIGMVSAPNSTIAHRIAEMQFINSRIHKVMELTPPEEETRFPGARFINGEFRPVS